MKHFELKIYYKLLACTLITLAVSCHKEDATEEPATSNAKGLIQSEAVSCSFPFCDITRNPDIGLKSNVHDAAYINANYPTTVNPIRFTPNYISTAYDSSHYGWKTGEVVNRVGLFCLTENVAPRTWNDAELNWSKNDWIWDATKGRNPNYPQNDWIFDNLFRFDCFELIDGYWHGLYSDYKNSFNPSQIEKKPYIDSMLNPFGIMQRYWNYYDYPYRQLAAQTGDIYFNPIRFPPHDGVYNCIATFNPEVGDCRVVKETDYSNNYFLAPVQIQEGSLSVVDVHGSILPVTTFIGTISKKNKTIVFDIECPYMGKVYHKFTVRGSDGTLVTTTANQFEIPISPPFKTDYWVKIMVPELGESVEIKCVKN